MSIKNVLAGFKVCGVHPFNWAAFDVTEEECKNIWCWHVYIRPRKQNYCIVPGKHPRSSFDVPVTFWGIPCGHLHSDGWTTQAPPLSNHSASIFGAWALSTHGYLPGRIRYWQLLWPTVWGIDKSMFVWLWKTKLIKCLVLMSRSQIFCKCRLWVSSECNVSTLLQYSPVYMMPLTRIRIQIKLIRVHVNALIRIAIRVT